MIHGGTSTSETHHMTQASAGQHCGDAHWDWKKYFARITTEHAMPATNSVAFTRRSFRDRLYITYTWSCRTTGRCQHARVDRGSNRDSPSTTSTTMAVPIALAHEKTLHLGHALGVNGIKMRRKDGSALLYTS